jgi:hypothetical protein
MDEPEAEPAASQSHVTGTRYRRRARFEVIFASVWLAVGLFVLPATIFAVGGALLGPYGDDRGLAPSTATSSAIWPSRRCGLGRSRSVPWC